MANKEIKTVFKLDGEKEYKSAVKNINTELRVLSSEMKKTTAAFDENDKSMRSLKAQNEILQKQYDKQREKVEYLKNAVKDSTEAYDKAKAKYEEIAAAQGKESAEAVKAAKAMKDAQEAVTSFTIQLNNSEIALGKSEEALKTNQKELRKLSNVKVTDLVPEAAVEGVEKAEKVIKKTATAAKNLASAFGSAAAQAAKIGSATLEKTFKASAAALTAYSTAATAAGKALVNITAESGAFADDINTLSKQTGLDTETLQKLTYAESLIDVEVGTISKSMARLTKNMTSTSAEVQGAFEALGVSVKDNVTGELRNNEDVFNDLIKALGNVANETERDNLAMQIFGKSAQELNPLILGGADQLKELGDSAKSAGLILSQEALDSLNEFNDSIDVLKGNLSAAKNVVAVEFAGSFKTFSDKIGRSIPDLSRALSGMFNPATAAESKKEFERLLTELSTDLSADIEQLLPVFLDGFNAVFGSVGKMLPGAVATLLPYLVDGLNNLTQDFVKAIPELLPVVVEGGITLFTGLIGGLNEAIELLTPMLPGIIEDVTTTLIESLPLLVETGFTLFVGIIKGLSEATPQIVTAIKELIPLLSDTIIENLPLLISAGIDLIGALISGIFEALPDLLASVGDIAASMIDKLGEVDWLTEGENIFRGLGDGLVNVFSAALGAIDTAFGTEIQKLYDQMAAFNYQVGVQLAKQDNLIANNKMIMESEANDLKTDVLLKSNQYIREGMSPREATERARLEIVKDDHSAWIYDRYVKEEIESEEALNERYNTIKNAGLIGGYGASLGRSSASANYYAQQGKAASQRISDEAENNKKLLEEQKKYAEQSEKIVEESAKNKEEVTKKSEKKLVSAVTESNDDKLEAVKEWQKEEKEAYDKYADEELEILKEKHKKETANLKEAIEAEKALLQESHNAKLKQYDEEYMAKLRATDEEKYEKVKVLEDEIDRIEGLTKAEEEAAKKEAEQAKLRELQNKVYSAATYEERQSAEAALAEYQKELNRQRVLEERESRISEIEEAIKTVEEEYKAKSKAIEDEYSAEKNAENQLFEEKMEELSIEQEERQRLLEQNQQAEIEALQAVWDEEKKQLEIRQNAELAALAERNTTYISNLKKQKNAEFNVLSEKKARELADIREIHATELSEYKALVAQKKSLFSFDENSISSGLFAYYDQIGKASLAEKELDNTGATAQPKGTTATGGGAGKKTTVNNTFINNSPKALTAYEQAQLNERQLEATKRYELA